MRGGNSLERSVVLLFFHKNDEVGIFSVECWQLFEQTNVIRYRVSNNCVKAMKQDLVSLQIIVHMRYQV